MRIAESPQRLAYRIERLAGLGREMVLDGEIAVPDSNGVTHISDMLEAVMRKQGERFAFFAFDLLHIDGHDVRACPIEKRKEILGTSSTMRNARASSTCPT